MSDTATPGFTPFNPTTPPAVPPAPETNPPAREPRQKRKPRGAKPPKEKKGSKKQRKPRTTRAQRQPATDHAAATVLPTTEGMPPLSAIMAGLITLPDTHWEHFSKMLDRFADIPVESRSRIATALAKVFA